MKKTFMLFGFVFVFLAGVALVFGSTVADVAKKEKERRANTKAPAKVFTNQDVEDFKAKNKDQDTVTSEETQTQEGEVKDEDTSSAPPEDQSNNEEYWRGRYKDAVGKVQALQEKADQLQKDINGVNLNVTNYEGVAAGPQLQAQIGSMKDELAKTQQELEAAKQAIADLEDEARKAGAPPGWVRE